MLINKEEIKIKDPGKVQSFGKNIWYMPGISSYLDHALKEQKLLNSFFDNPSFSSHSLYRGSNDAFADNNLTPKIGRFHSGDIIDRERMLFEDFKRHAFPFLPSHFNVKSDWDWLSLGRHFELPTRFLDWSDRPLVALYFAFVGESKSKLRSVTKITIENKDMLTEQEEKDGPFSVKKIKWFNPNQVTSRITAQSGLFSVHPFNSKGNLEKIEDVPGVQKSMISYLFPNEPEKILRELDVYGINHYSIFPDLGGLCKSLEHRYLINRY